MPFIIGGIAAGIGAAIAGATVLGAIIVAGITTVLGLISWLIGRPRRPEMRERTETVRSAVSPRHYVYGKIMKSGTLVFAGTPTDTKYNNLMYVVIAVAGHHCKKIGPVFFNDEFSSAEKYSRYASWLSTLTEWDSGTVYDPYVGEGDYGDVVKYGREEDGEPVRAWRKITNQQTEVSTGVYLPPTEDCENWEEFGWWYTIRRHLGGDDQTVDTMLSANPVRWAKNMTDLPIENGVGTTIWDATKRLQGIAYITVKLRFSAEDSSWINGLPNIKCLVEGYDNIYDPRTATYGYSNNPVLCIADYITNQKFGMAREGSTGLLPEVDYTFIEDEADYCDELLLAKWYDTSPFTVAQNTVVINAASIQDYKDEDEYQNFSEWKATSNQVYRIRLVTDDDGTEKAYVAYLGGLVAEAPHTIEVFQDEARTTPGWTLENTSDPGQVGIAVEGVPPGDYQHYIVFDDRCITKRFECNGLIESTYKHIDNVRNMLSSMAGNIVWYNGKYRIYVGRYRQPTVKITESDVIGPIRVVPLLDRKDTYNIVNGTFVDPDNQWQPNNFPEIRYPQSLIDLEDNGAEMPMNIELQFTTDSSMAARIAKIMLYRLRNQMRVSFMGNYGLFPVTAMQNVRLYFPSIWPSLVLDADLHEFIVENWKFQFPVMGDPGGVVLELAEETEEAYAFSYLDHTLPIRKDTGSSDSYVQIIPDVDNNELDVPSNFNIALELSQFLYGGNLLRIHFSWSAYKDVRAALIHVVYEQENLDITKSVSNRVDRQSDAGTLSVNVYSAVLTTLKDTGKDFTPYAKATDGDSLIEYKVRMITSNDRVFFGFLGNLYGVGTDEITIYEDLTFGKSKWQYPFTGQSLEVGETVVSYDIYKVYQLNALKDLGFSMAKDQLQLDRQTTAFYVGSNTASWDNVLSQFFKRFGKTSIMFARARTENRGYFTNIFGAPNNFTKLASAWTDWDSAVWDNKDTHPLPLEWLRAYDISDYGRTDKVLLEWAEPEDTDIVEYVIRRGDSWTDYDTEWTVAYGQNSLEVYDTWMTKWYFIRPKNSQDNLSEISTTAFVEKMYDGKVFMDYTTSLVSVTTQSTIRSISQSNQEPEVYYEQHDGSGTIVVGGGTAPGITFIPHSTQLYVNGVKLIEKTDDTQSPDIWEYEEDYLNGTVTVRNPADNSPSGANIEVRFIRHWGAGA